MRHLIFLIDLLLVKDFSGGEQLFMDKRSDIQKNLMRRATFGDGLRRNAKRNPKKPLIIYYDQNFNRVVYTYEEINEKANRFANSMLKLGVKKGDVIAIMSRNTPQYVIAWFGLTKIGAILTGVNFTFKEKEIAYQVNHAEAKLLIVEDTFLDVAQLAKKELDKVRHFVSFNISGKPVDQDWEDFDSLISSEHSSVEPEVEIDDTDVALLVYTSGTESFPKGVMIQHRNYYCSTILSFILDLGLNANEVFLYFMPFYTVSGIGTFTSSVIAGATMILPLTIDPQKALQIIKEEKVTMVSQTPTFYQKLAQLPGFDESDLSTILKCTTYGGLMPRSMLEVWSKVAPQMKWATYWGQTELSQLGCVGWFSKIEDIPGQDPTWIGKPVTTLEVKVVDEDGNDVTAGYGELICRGPSASLGYYKDEEKTLQTFKNGWVHTGDLVRIDEDGNLFFFDRKKDVIKSGGLNVSSFEVQDVIYKHPKVAEVAVIGIQDDVWSEIVAAVVVPKSGEELDEKEILKLCKDSIAAFKVPKRVILLDELPKDTQGKILKRELRRQFTQTE